MDDHSVERLRGAFGRARQRREPWERLWRDCCAYAMPVRGFGLGSEFAAGGRFAELTFDGTASDGVDQLAASLLAHLTPPWSRWFGLRPGPAVPSPMAGG